MKRFLLGLIKFFILPVFILTFIGFFYIRRDVYLDIRQYKNYSWKYSYQSLGDISTKKLLSNPTTKYNSFILGSSRSTGLYACYLQKRLKNTSFFHYANWNESIGGVYAKLKLLDSLNYSLQNIFIYIDTDYTFDNDGRCNSNDHYLLTGEDKYSYYFKHYRSFIPPVLDYDKIKILFGFKVLDVFPNWNSDLITNDCNHSCSDSGVLEGYGSKVLDRRYKFKIDSLEKSGFFYKRSLNQKYKEKQISIYEKKILKKIKKIFEKHNSRYYIVITPLYDQLKFNKEDIETIKNVFNNEVYDFSGINSITNDKYNYPDRKHFQPYISKAIVDSIFKSKL